MIKSGSSLKLIELCQAGVCAQTLPEFESVLPKVLSSSGGGLAATAAVVTAAARLLYDDGVQGQDNTHRSLRGRAQELLFSIFSAFLKAKIALPADLSRLLGEVVADCDELTQERPWFLSMQEISNGDFLAAVCLAAAARPSSDSSALLNYAFLNNLKQWEFADKASAGPLRQKIDATVYAVFQAEFRASPEQSLLLLPGILASVFNPLYFAGFVQQTFSDAPKMGLKILALESLLVLLGSTSFEWPDFYSSLFQLLQRELAHVSFSPSPVPGSPSLLRNRHTLRFLRLLDMALRTESLSKTIVASFVKVLLRLATKSSADVSTLLCFLVFNVVKKRQALKPLMAVPRDFDWAKDPFRPEADLYSNSVLDSCFWEMELLKRHHDSRASRAIRSLAGNEVAAPRFEFGDLKLGKFDAFPVD